MDFSRPAAARGALVLLLLLPGVRAWSGDEPGRALLDAAARGERARLSALLAAGADPEARDGDGRPALLLAAASGREDAVEVLLRAGATADVATGSGWTPLHEAAEDDRLEVARVLLAAGANPDPLDRTRGTPLDVAEEEGHEGVARLLREEGARGSGEAIGDTVCVRPWSGEGFCAVVVDRDVTRHRLRVTGVVGCDTSCPADTACSGGRPVGPGGLSKGDTLWVPTSCLTHTGLR